MLLRAIFFDAGNTLVFPNLERTLAPLHARGIRPEREQLHAAGRTAKRKLDAGELTGNGNSVDFNYWYAYYSELLTQLGLPDEELKLALIQGFEAIRRLGFRSARHPRGARATTR